MSSSASPRPKNWLLAKSRQWHIWGGLIAAAFLLVVSLTGMVLNYKKPLLVALGLETPPVKERAGAKGPDDARTAATLANFPIQYGQALGIAGRELGDTPLERVELKREQGAWFYKVKAHSGEELWVSAATGEHFIKGQYEKVRRIGAGAPVKSFDWGKVLLDLHTGKIGGPVGQAVMTVVAGLLFWLTVSGLYVYTKPRLLRRATQKQPVAVSNMAQPSATAMIVPPAIPVRES